MQFLAGALWWAITRLFTWIFSAVGLSAATRWLAGLLTPFVGGAARWLSMLLIGGTVVGGAAYTGLLRRIGEEIRLFFIDVVVWLVDQALGLALWALDLLDNILPAASTVFGGFPTWALQLGQASGLFLYVFICLGGAVAIKLIRLIPFIKI
ncbi:hypothetical protein ACM64Y_01800 [Novispirillum sp. DQ9]|uniref:hypothetical protein n=1 Tax=Novispirillum sp. DQ9 TaxID=3398612 RepID=UPI003C7B5FEE